MGTPRVVDASVRSTWDVVFTGKRWGRWPNESVVRAVMRHLAPGARVLEVGCGAGAQLRFLNDEGFRTFGSDFSGAALHAVDVAVPLTCADGRMLPYRSASLDAVIEVEVATCMADPAPLIDEVRRVLRADGLFVSVCFTDECSVDVGADSGGFHPHDFVAAFDVLDSEVVRRERGETVVVERTVVVRGADLTRTAAR